MSCCEGTRSLHKRYKISLATGGKAGRSEPTTTTAAAATLSPSPPANDSSRVCGMAIADLTTRHSDSSSGGNRRADGARDTDLSISTTKSDPRFSRNDSSSSSSSIISPARTRRRTTGSDTARRKCVVVGSPRTGWGHQRRQVGRLLVVFVSSILLVLLSAPDRAGAVLLDTNGGVGGAGEGKAPVQAFGDELGGVNLERSIAAVFSRVAYGSTTTTKRSIPDNVYVPSLTTVSTPLLTTFRYDNKNKDALGGSSPGGGAGLGEKDSHYNQQQISANHRNYELDLERDHVLPTSAPNAEILKSNSNPTYPNPNRHHNHDRHRHSNSTPYPHGHNAKKGFPTNSMFAGDIPAYSPPSRTFFTPPLPRNYTNPFADKPTLRGTNSDSTIINTGTYANRRPLPPPSLMPGHERIPMRPPDLVPGAPGAGNLGGGLAPLPNPAGNGPSSKVGPDNGGMLPAGSSGLPNSQSMDAQRKKALNTPSEKSNKLDAAKGGYDGNSKLFLLDENANSSAILPNGMHFPSISRILSGSNGRPQMIPDVLLRSVTSAPRPNQPAYDLGGGGGGLGGGTTSLSNAKNPGSRPGGLDGDRDRDGGDGGASEGPEGGDGRRHFEDDEGENDEDEEDEEDDPFEEGAARQQPSGGSTSHIATSTVSSMHVQSSSSSPITQRMPNLNLKSVMIKNGTGEEGAGGGNAGGAYGNDRNFQGEIADISTWTIAWNVHVYLSAILFTILAVYSIFKIIFYDKLTHLFSQAYFISIHLILIIICLLRIFYLCYDAYNMHFSFNLFVSELLLNLPLTFLTTTFAILILFLLLRSINHKTNRYSSILRPLTIMIGSGVHVTLCITLHLVESYETKQFYHKQHQLQLANKQLLGAGTGMGGRGGGVHAPPTNIQIPPRVLSLICQIIYIFICLSLGILYLYMYRLLKRILHKSQNYIHGYNNLSYAIHITIATALLFILLAALQIYGAISISSQTRVKLSPSSGLPGDVPGGRPGGGGGAGGGGTLWASHIEIDWFQWGYQFSIRFIEIVIVALLSWVTGLKTGTSKVIQREKDMEQPNASGFALFPCTSSSSQENFETDYPAVCNTNRNLHTYTMRTGKPIYDDNFALNSLNLEPNNQQDLQLGPPGGVPVGANEFQRSLETNSMRSSSHNYSNNYNGSSSNNEHGIVGGGPDSADDFLNETEPMPDHYENPNFELKHHHQQQHHHQHSGGGGSVGASSNQYHDIMDNCYSEPIGAPQYDTKSLRGGQPAPPSGHPMAPPPHHRNYDFQNFERPNFDPQHLPPAVPQPHSALSAAQSMARGEFRASKNLKTLKSGQLQNDLGGGGGANTMGHHHYNHHQQQQQGGGPMVPGPGDSFDRRIGVRKSGTLNNIGAMHFNPHGSGRNNNSNSSASSSSSNNRAVQQQQRRAGPMSGAQTLSSAAAHHHPQQQQHQGGFVAHPGSFNDRLLNGGGIGADSLERIAAHDGNFDDGGSGSGTGYYHSKKRSRDSSSSGYAGGGPVVVPYATSNDHHHQHHAAHHHDSSSSPTASLGGSGNGTPTSGPPNGGGILPGKIEPRAAQDNGSMLVAEQGFVRFRALEEPALGSRTNLRDKGGKMFINS
uniref:Proline-rich transmembrane protein 3/4 domain-containing protein n=1 Tax=Anopheles quadriannulatus TaxID=34691 RepID=A0A182WYC1_ANOQN